jgi:hypothetical protein
MKKMATTTPTILRKLPREVREMVYGMTMGREMVIYTHPLGRSRKIGITPPFLIALRADRKVYLEALTVHYAMNQFTLREESFKSLQFDLIPSTVAMIQNLKIKIKWVFLPKSTSLLTKCP